MKVHEYQSKMLLSAYGIPVPPGKVAVTPKEAEIVASELGGKVVIKAQVHAGGRGKAGGVKQADTAAEAAAIAAGMIGTNLVTAQTSATGVPVNKVLVEKALAIERELYLGIVIDNAARAPVMIASTAGGMDIEEVTCRSPKEILTVQMDAGFLDFLGRKLAYGMRLAPDQARQAVRLMANLYRLFREKDCSLAEINPLAVTPDGNVVALDAKLNFDDSALFRHADIREMQDTEQDDPFERIASGLDIKNYVKLDGNIGCMVNGAGLAMAALDLIKYSGGKAANFLDIGTLNNPNLVVNAFKVFDADPHVRAILVNVFGGMARVDVIARGIVEAHKQIKVRVPVIVRLAGTNVAEGKRILAESGIAYIEAADFYDAAHKATAAAAAAAS